MARRFDSPGRQGGVALLIFVILLSIISIGFYFRSISIEDLKLEREMQNRRALSAAKAALLDYAVTYVDANPGEFGFLPCPDKAANSPPPPSPPEGSSDGACDGKKVNTLGMFPWASLDTGILRAGGDRCLWYAVSGEYKNVNVSTKTEMLNEDTNGAFRLFDADGNTIAGASPDSRVVAAVFDPGMAVEGQVRNIDPNSLCGKDYSASHFLEGNGVHDNALLSAGALAIDALIQRGNDSDERATPFNDSIATITRRELWDAVTRRADFTNSANSKMRRLTEALALCVAAYGNNGGNRRLPRPAPLDFTGADYRQDGNYNDTLAVSYLGRYPHTVDDSDAVLGVNAPAGGFPVLFDKGFCSALTVAGQPADLDTGSASEYYNLWKNWKDHFFYAVSAYYAPTAAADTGVPSCDGTNCVTVNGVEYAAVVIFSNSRTGAQVRNEPVAGDVDTKRNLANYIEVNNPAGSGTGDYTPAGNDIMYCITDSLPLTAVPCP